jgi:hypothetical protein
VVKSILNTHDINYFMRKKNDFLGCYACNDVPCFGKYSRGCIIINKDTNNLRGRHWVCVKFGNGRARYFDPAGCFLIKSIAKKFRHYKILYTLRPSQNLLSTYCGHHVIFFLYNDVCALNDTIASLYINKNLI